MTINLHPLEILLFAGLYTLLVAYVFYNFGITNGRMADWFKFWESVRKSWGDTLLDRDKMIEEHERLKQRVQELEKEKEQWWMTWEEIKEEPYGD
jgi:hypothetical protein